MVPGLTPEYVLECIKTHLKKEGFDRIKVTFTLGEESYRSDMSDPAIVNVIELAKGFYEEGVCCASNGSRYRAYAYDSSGFGCSYGSLWHRKC